MAKKRSNERIISDKIYCRHKLILSHHCVSLLGWQANFVANIIYWLETRKHEPFCSLKDGNVFLTVIAELPMRHSPSTDFVILRRIKDTLLYTNNNTYIALQIHYLLGETSNIIKFIFTIKITHHQKHQIQNRFKHQGIKYQRRKK